jgi:hypothetical protein
MRKAELFSAEVNPSCARPDYKPLEYCENLVRVHRAVQIGPRSFHRIPLITVLEAETGYDRAVTRGPAHSMLQVWEVRTSGFHERMAVWQMGHQGKYRQTAIAKQAPSSNGFPDRMHIRKEAKEFEVGTAHEEAIREDFNRKCTEAGT